MSVCAGSSRNPQAAVLDDPAILAIAARDASRAAPGIYEFTPVKGATGIVRRPKVIP
jgi:hypothetical protein